MGMPLDDLSHLGDPAGMESLAVGLLLRAESVAGVARSLSRQVEEMTFEGPAAGHLRDATMRRRRRAERLVGELEETAHLLKRSAAVAREHIEAAERASGARKVDP